MHNGGGPHGAQYSYGPPNAPPNGSQQQGYQPGHHPPGSHPLPAGFHPQYHHHPMPGPNIHHLIVQQQNGGGTNTPPNGK